MVLFCVFTLSLSIILSGSRAGILTLILVYGIFFWKKIHITFFAKVASIFFIVLFTSIGLYFLKKDSADGRLLIWQCSGNMILDKPLFGYGTGGFEAHYMDYQAAYFDKTPNSKYNMLADTVQHPFNEYIRIAVDYGMIGLFLLFLYIGFMIYCYRKDPNICSQTAFMCLASIACFSFFSYPFMYPFVWFMFLACSFIVVKNSEIIKLYLSSVLKKMVCMALIITFSFAIYRLYTRMQADIIWCNLTERSNFAQPDILFLQYDAIYPLLKNDRYFLYNYSAVLHGRERYEKSLTLAKECRKLWADYDLEMLIAENCNKLKQFKDAEQHYALASRMCPNRFVPLYSMVLLYLTEQRTKDAKNLAQFIIEKDVKVQTDIVRRIKEEMEELFDN